MRPKRRYIHVLSACNVSYTSIHKSKVNSVPCKMRILATSVFLCSRYDIHGSLASLRLLANLCKSWTVNSVLLTAVLSVRSQAYPSRIQFRGHCLLTLLWISYTCKSTLALLTTVAVLQHIFSSQRSIRAYSDSMYIIFFFPELPFIPMSSVLQVSTGHSVRCHYDNSYGDRARNALVCQGNRKL